MTTSIDEREQFYTNYWMALSDKGKSNIIRPIIENWTHYTIGDENSSFKGHYGRAFEIVMLNGDIIHTTNLWHQGTIPEQYRHLFENNALSVTSI